VTPNQISKIKAIDSHTCGEPTRIVVEGGPELGTGSLSIRKEKFRLNYDYIRSAVVNEPRGSDVIVGALLCEPEDPRCSAGVIFFNNVGFLGMCGHGTIGLVRTLGYMNRIKPGTHVIETPVGTVDAVLHESGEVTITNVPSYRYLKDIEIFVENYGHMKGDVAWGGNWFYLVEKHGLEINFKNLGTLTDCSKKVRKILSENGITGENGQFIDHIELFGPPSSNAAHSRNFVLCPGDAYDRSPCGTGTSAKMACLYDKGLLSSGQVWRQESIVGTIFEGKLNVIGNKLYPQIKGSAYIIGESTLILDSSDPFCMGIYDYSGSL
jgi:4-hydroxyproline epimerase